MLHSIRKKHDYVVRVSELVVGHYIHTHVWKEMGDVDGKDGGVGETCIYKQMDGRDASARS
jgi:hypothetical protein